MKKIVYPFKVDGRNKAMPSKSFIQRAMTIAALCNETTILKNIKWSADALAALDIIDQLNCNTNINDYLTIYPTTQSLTQPFHLNAGESGLSMRLFSAVSMLYNFPITISGSGSLMRRSIASMTTIMDQMGIKNYSQNNTLPITIQGPILPGKYEINCAEGSQFLSGLLITLPLLAEDSELSVSQLSSRPYIDMTLQIMRDFGVDVTHDDYKHFFIPGNQSYVGRAYYIEGDWSAISNLMVAAAISGKITIAAINPNSLQADRSILDALSLFGAHIDIGQDEITISQDEMKSFNFDATHCPDLFPPLVVLAAAATGTSIIKGTHRLLNKESDRLLSLVTNFSALGLDIQSKGDDLIIKGHGKLKGGKIDSFFDHRIAMAGSIAATLCTEPILILNAEAINKSYPDFYADLHAISLFDKC